jgi:integrase
MKDLRFNHFLIMASYGFFLRPTTHRNGGPGRLYLRIVHGGESRSVTTGYRVFPQEWDSSARRILHPYGRSERGRELYEIESAMMGDIRRMDGVVAGLERSGAYTVDLLMTRYRALMTGNTLRACAERLAVGLERDGLARTAKSYRSAAARLVAFNGGADPHLDQLSSRLLGDFQYALKSDGLKPNTISFYMRTLRAIYHKSIAEGRTVQRAENIFAGVYTGVAPTRKLALTAAELALLAAHDPTLTGEGAASRDPLPPHLAQALAMFLFCYHARGMCFVDMAHLKKADLRGDTIAYHRHKTGQRIELLVLPAMRRIIDWFAPYVSGSPYLFPVLTSSASDLALQYASGLRLQNHRLKKIAERCGILKKFSTHCARHSWATIAKNANLPLAVISEGLGHSNQQTTEIYLASLERSVLDNASRIVSDAIVPQTPTAT